MVDAFNYIVKVIEDFVHWIVDTFIQPILDAVTDYIDGIVNALKNMFLAISWFEPANYTNGSRQEKDEHVHIAFVSGIGFLLSFFGLQSSSIDFYNAISDILKYIRPLMAFIDLSGVIEFIGEAIGFSLGMIGEIVETAFISAVSALADIMKSLKNSILSGNISTSGWLVPSWDAWFNFNDALGNISIFHSVISILKEADPPELPLLDLALIFIVILIPILEIIGSIVKHMSDPEGLFLIVSEMLIMMGTISAFSSAREKNKMDALIGAVMASIGYVKFIINILSHGKIIKRLLLIFATLLSNMNFPLYNALKVLCKGLNKFGKYIGHTVPLPILMLGNTLALGFAWYSVYAA